MEQGLAPARLLTYRLSYMTGLESLYGFGILYADINALQAVLNSPGAIWTVWADNLDSL